MQHPWALEKRGRAQSLKSTTFYYFIFFYIELILGDKKLDKYECLECSYIYDPELGDDSQGISPGTPFEDLPVDWVCPECGVGKDRFQKIVHA